MNDRMFLNFKLFAFLFAHFVHTFGFRRYTRYMAIFYREKWANIERRGANKHNYIDWVGANKRKNDIDWVNVATMCLCTDQMNFGHKQSRLACGKYLYDAHVFFGYFSTSLRRELPKTIHTDEMYILYVYFPFEESFFELVSSKKQLQCSPANVYISKVWHFIKAQRTSRYTELMIFFFYKSEHIHQIITCELT